MSNINDGGSAFPHTMSQGHPDYAGGMSLRDYFAAHTDIQDVEFPSLQSIADFLGVPMPDEDDFAALLEMTAQVQAKLRYMAADAMLKAREVKP